MSRTPRLCRMSRGFTLVELLVVVSIIAMLLSLLLPALNKAREAARAAACMANLHSLGLGMTMYDSEYGGVPRANNDGKDITLGTPDDGDWIKHLAPYMRGEDQPKYLANYSFQKDPLYVCPSVFVKRTGPATVQIGMNGFMDTGSPTDYVAPQASAPPKDTITNPLTGKPTNSVIPIHLAPRPADIFLLGDKSLMPLAWNPYIKPSLVEDFRPDLRHDDKAQIVLVDGHCDRFDLDDVLDEATHYVWWR